MANANYIRIGQSDVTFNSVALGHTKGGVDVKYDPNYAELNVDQYGKTAVDMALVEEKFTVKAALAEITGANWAVAVPFGTYTSGTAPGGSVKGGANAGGVASAYAHALVLHPSKNASSDTGEDITVFKAVVTEAIDVKYNVDAQRVLELTWTALIDETQTAGSRLFRVGPSSVS